MTEAGKMKSHAESEIPAAVIVQDVIMEGVRISSDGRCGRRAFFDATDASNPAGGTGEAAADFANVRRLHNRPAHGQPAGGSYFIRFLTGGKEPCYNIGETEKRVMRRRRRQKRFRRRFCRSYSVKEMPFFSDFGGHAHRAALRNGVF